jgi:drug/metabolite transporter (DMT)-like permease
MWIVLALLAAFASAGTSLLLKRAVSLAGVVVSTVAFRTIAGVLLALSCLRAEAWHALTPTYWRAVGVVIPNEIGGMLCLSLALSLGDLSVVQPIMGLIPLLTMVGGAIFLHEVPSPIAVVGIALVVTGLYFVGLRRGGSAWEPIRAFATSRASWYGLLAALFWTVTSLTHKIGIGEVGPMPWATTLTLGSGLALAVALPFVARSSGGLGLPVSEEAMPWLRVVALTSVCFAVQQFGLHNALRRSQAGYVMAVVSTSILIATAVGVLVLRERGGSHRITGALLVSSGVGLIAIFG